VSEVPLNTPYHSGLFPKRNRLLAGLSLAVLVIEATLKSGALITAYQALNQGKEVFAMPGHVDSSRSFGPHQLIEEGAAIALSPEFIVQQLLNLLKTKSV
jgi:DNA processing protein